MEERVITQRKTYKLLLNRMVGRSENVELVAIGYDKQKLIDWYEEQKVLPYQDGSWHKVFRKGSDLEWNNPLEFSDFGGIQEEWTTQEAINGYMLYAGDSFGFVRIPTIVE